MEINLNNNKGPPPPINNACLPDIYNRLDADAVRKTEVANSRLALGLNTQEKIISKYRHQAEHSLSLAKTSASHDLSRIRDTLPRISRVSDFDNKFFRGDPMSADYEARRKPKHYLMKTNDGSTCHRCFVHHMPSKKTFYKPAPVSPLTDFELKKIPLSAPTQSNPESPQFSYPLYTDTGSPMPPRPASSSPLFANRVMPPSRKYQFLVRDRYGREKDLNDTPTPRLVPYEMWKDVVNNVSKQTMKASKYLPKLNKRGSHRCGSQARDKMADATLEGRGHRSSSRGQSRRGQSESRPLSRHVKIASRPVSRSVSRQTGKERLSQSRLGSRSRRRDV